MSAETWISLYEPYAAEQTDAPPCYHTYMAHAVLGATIGKRVWLQGWGSKRIYPNVFLLLLGPSSRARKGTATDIGTRLLKLVNAPQLVGTASPESIRDDIADPENGAEDGWFFINEFARVLKMAKKDYAADIDQFYCDLFDGCVKGRTKKGGRILLEDLAPTVFTGAIQHIFERLVREEDMNSGFMARFVIVPAPDDLPEQSYDQTPPNMALQNMLVHQLHKLRSLKPHEATIQPAARTILQQASRRIDQDFKAGKMPKDLDAYTARLQTIMYKFALSAACSRQVFDMALEDEAVIRVQIEVTVADAQDAARKVNWLIDRAMDMMKNMAFTTTASECREVEAQIRTAKSIKWRDLLRQNRSLRADELKMIVERLIQEGTVTTQKQKTTGRPITLFLWSGNGKEPEPFTPLPSRTEADIRTEA